MDNLQKVYSENYPRIDGLDSKLNQTDARLDLLENHLAGINASLSEQLEHLAATWGKNWPRVAELAGILNEGNKRLDNLEEERSAFNQSQSLVRLEALEKDFSAWRLGNFETEERIKILDKITSRWSSLLNQIRLLELKIKGQGPAGPKKQLAEKVSTVFPTDFDYLAFEDEFRTPPDLLKEHQKRYLKYFKKCRQVLDIGCGRGEFLELLKNNRINGSGVDSNELLVLEGRRKKLAVVLGKVPAYLDLLEADSLDGVFISHLVEHLSPQELVELILKVSLKMEKKAYLIIETVNPLSFFSLANFYLDLTHTRPVLPRTLEFLATRAGLKKESFELLSAVSEDLSLKKEGLGSQLILENFDKINRAIFGHRDYVLIFKK
jgi:SAM-dependent methyltransferase